MTEWPNWTELITNEAFHLCLKVWNASIRISHVNNAKHVNKGPYPIHTHTYKPQLLFVPCRGNRDQKVNISWIIENAREFQKNIYFCFIDYAKAFDSVNHNKLWKILQEIKIPDQLPASWEICMQVKKQQLELDMEQWLFPNWERSAWRLCIVTLFI